MTQDNGGIIKLYGFSPAWSLPDCSPFVMKIDCYLRMTRLQYELVHWQSLRDMQRAPKGKLPWIEDGEKKIADSDFIISYLQKTYGDRLEENSLSPSDRAAALSMRRPYFMGRVPTSLDAAMYGFLAHLIYADYESPLNSHAKSFVNLRSYCER